MTKPGEVFFGYDLADGVSRAACVEMTRQEDGTLLITGSWVGKEAEAEIERRKAASAPVEKG